MAPAAGRRGSWAVLGGLAAVAVLQSPACIEDPGTPDDEPVDAVGALLADVGPEVVIPTLERFRERAVALEDAAAAWADATEAGEGVDDARSAARDAWWDAMGVWQEAELHQLGPAAPSTAIGGRALRDEILSWPTVNPCRVDQRTAQGGWEDPAWFDGERVNAYGLDALEHLLHAGPDNACPNQIDINADGTWDALGADGVEAARAGYAETIAGRLVHDADRLIAAWTDEGFADALANAGDGAPYPTQHEGLDAVYGALFVLEAHVKDRKLGVPLGVTECAAETCPEDVESRASGGSTAWIEANLVGFRALFTGGDGAGMDDLLEKAGHGDLAEAVLTDLDAAVAAARAVQGPIDVALAEDPESVQTLYDAIRAVTTPLKGDIATVLALQVPSEAAGDND